jgi:hypothetical protein
MKKFLHSKNAILILGGGSILVIIYMIASLAGLDLKPATPFAIFRETKALASGGLPPLNGIGYLIVFFVALLVIIFIFLPPDQKKKFLFGLALLVLAGGLIFLLFSQAGAGRRMEPPLDTPLGMVRTLSYQPAETPAPPVTPSVFIPPQVSFLTSYMIALMFILVIGCFWIWLVWRRRKMRAPYDELAEIARSALDDIVAGRDWGDTILNSYQRMNYAVAEWRGLHRQVGMTPAEFADHLVSAHLPGEAVHRLTVLFECVRYGEKKPTSADIQEAVGCLTAILDYCQAVK